MIYLSHFKISIIALLFLLSGHSYSYESCDSFIDIHVREDLESERTINIGDALSFLKNDDSICSFKLLVDLWEKSDKKEHEKFNWQKIYSDESRIKIALLIKEKMNNENYIYNLDKIREFALNKTWADNSTDSELIMAASILSGFNDKSALNNLKKAALKQRNNLNLYGMYIALISSMCVQDVSEHAGMLISKISNSDEKEKIKRKSQEIIEFVKDACASMRKRGEV